MEQFVTFFVSGNSQKEELPPKIYLFRCPRDLVMHVGRQVLAIQDPSIPLPGNKSAGEIARFQQEWVSHRQKSVQLLLGEKFCGGDQLGESEVIIKTPSFINRMGTIFLGGSICPRIETALQPQGSMSTGLELVSCYNCGKAHYRRTPIIPDDAFKNLICG